jgi:hypothetical protein
MLHVEIANPVTAAKQVGNGLKEAWIRGPIYAEYEICGPYL